MDYEKIIGICGTIKRVAHQVKNNSIDEKDGERIIESLVNQISNK